MALKEKIESIRPYFVTCNIAEGAICIVVGFPKGWVVPDSKMLLDDYKTLVQRKDDKYFFMTEIENGEDQLFSAIENIIQSNKEMESKKELLTRKVNELKEIFLSEPLEKLLTLSFVFDNKPQEQKKITKPKVKQQKEAIVETIEDNQEKVEYLDTIESNVEENNNISCVENSSLMNLAVEIVS